jgi:transcriptional regulator with XRE-family HTH domain
MKKSQNYKEFGEFLTEHRRAKNMDQGAIAKAMGCSQQSVSSWEAGYTRPKAALIGKLAGLLGLDPASLSQKTAYVPAQRLAAKSHDQPFPLDQLPAETFERFTAYLLGLLHPEAQVMRAGTSGHKQGGLDIVVTFPDGRRHSFQCKRVKQFGPAEVYRTVSEHTAEAQRKHLVLSRVASPQAVEAVRRADGWEIWDKESISQLIRTKLSPDDQSRLVDIFFQGKHEELLGRPGSSDWMLPEDFFRPLSQRDNPFNHTWQLQGHQQELAALEKAICQDKSPLVLLAAMAGMGKSRLLKELLERIRHAEPKTTIRMLSTAAELSREKLDLLGPGKKILAIDDAHDRNKLSVLFEYAASHWPEVTVLAATRPYAEARILREAAVYAISKVPVVKLGPLTKSDMLHLVEEALNSVNALPGWAEPIASIAHNSPLVATMAARIVVREGVSLEMAKNSDQLRLLILGKFKNLLTGGLDGRLDQALIATVLDILSLVQPFHVEDPQLIEFIRSLTNATDAEISRVLHFLANGGVLFRRGHQYRLMPDLLGDYLIEESCITSNGQLSHFAQSAIKQVPLSLLGNVLVNLGRLDWRRGNGDTSGSRLLDAMWKTFDEIEDAYDPRFEAIRDAAVFQPKQALQFVKARIRARKPIREAANIVRNVAFNPLYIEEACELLWQMGRDDRRELGQYPEQPIRVLGEMAQLKERTPLPLIEPVFNFGMRLLDRDDVWDSSYTPLDVLKPVLSCEGITTTVDGPHMVMSPFLVNYDAVSDMRLPLIKRLVELLTHPSAKVATLVARFLQTAIHGPRGNMNMRVPQEAEKKFTDEAANTLRAVVDAMEKQRLHPAVYLGLMTSVGWLAKHGRGPHAEEAKNIFGAVPKDLTFRVQEALADGMGHRFIDTSDAAKWQASVQDWIDGLVKELRRVFPDPVERLDFVSRALDELNQGGIANSSPYTLLYALFHGDVAYARIVIAAAVDNPESTAGTCLTGALRELMVHAPTEARALIGSFIKGKNVSLARGATAALAGEVPAREHEDIVFLDEAFAHADPQVVQEAMIVVAGWQQADVRPLIEMTKRVRLDLYPKLVHSFGMMWAGRNHRLLNALRRDDAAHLLKQLTNLPDLDDYWLQEITAHLSYHFPHETAEFFFARVELAATPETFNNIRPANYGPYSNRPLRFAESPEAGAIMAKIWTWLRQNEARDFHFQHNAATLFDAMFITGNGNTVNKEMVALFENMSEAASSVELKLMARVLRHADPRFVFTHRAFVTRLLKRCDEVDPEILRFTITELVASAISGVRGGIVGQPAPQDVEMVAGAKDALKHLPHKSPAVDLYQEIVTHGEWSLQRSAQDAEAFLNGNNT